MPSADSWFLRKVTFVRSHESFRREPVRAFGRLLLWAAITGHRGAAIVTIPLLSVRLWLPARWKGAAKLIFAFRERYEPELGFLWNWLQPGMTVLDAGSLYGVYTVTAAMRVGDSGRVIAMEPSREAYAVLTRNIALNNLTNVTLIQLALGLRSGRTLLYHHRDPGQNSFAWDAASTGVEEVGVTTLDGLLARLNIQRLDVLKLDVEGAELPAIQGGAESLRRFCPVIIAEIHPERSRRLGCEPEDFLGYLLAHRYTVFQYSPTSRKLRTIKTIAELQGPRVVATTGEATQRLTQEALRLWTS